MPVFDPSWTLQASQGVETRISPAEIAALRRRVAWRILPLVILLYLIAYLDRANIGFAKLRMANDLKFSEEVFGLGMGIFFIGYFILEIPGAVLVERWSARKWFARILITWGFISALTAFVRTPMQFYGIRFLLGLAEAGFFPGIIVYFTHWFASGDRARALSGLIMAVPLSLALGAPASALLLDVHWLELKGWQWLFICEGLRHAAGHPHPPAAQMNEEQHIKGGQSAQGPNLFGEEVRRPGHLQVRLREWFPGRAFALGRGWQPMPPEHVAYVTGAGLVPKLL
jgi:hypothetical protein